ncbi:MAG: hypothetical protein IJK61_07685 [Bacteroidetes bacterium]|nr:hypothetical protein [Bacteroidota bacterium]
MKKIFFFIMAFMVSLPLTAQNSNSNINVSISPAINSDLQQILLNRLMQEPSQSFCDDVNDTASGCDWSTIPWDNFVDFDTLPDFPDCPLVVSYRVRICPNNPLIRQIDLVDIMINLGDYPNCDSLYNYLSSGTPEENAIHYQEIKEDIYFSLSQREAEQMADLPPCDSLGNYLPQTVFYKEQACKAEIVLIYDFEPPFQLYNIPKFVFEDIACNREVGCCKTTFSFCQDSLGNINPHITKELLGTICEGYPIELDYEDLLRYYEKLYPGAYTIFQIYPCVNVCN